jgi:hypothetical protein
MDFTWLGSIPSAVATIIASIIALYISFQWRAQEIGKRRRAVAEEALVAAHEFALSVRMMKTTWILPAALKLQEKGEAIDENLFLKLKDRWVKEHEGCTIRLQKSRFLLLGYFGEDVSRLVEKMLDVDEQCIEDLNGLVMDVCREYARGKEVHDDAAGYRSAMFFEAKSRKADEILIKLNQKLRRLEEYLILELNLSARRRLLLSRMGQFKNAPQNKVAQLTVNALDLLLAKGNRIRARLSGEPGGKTPR